MDRNSNYYRQVQLLKSALPYVARETCFALKGGTAINLFHLPMPRLSVDIDLTYLPLEERGLSLMNARAALQRIVDDMTQSSPQSTTSFHAIQSHKFGHYSSHRSIWNFLIYCFNT
jgi:predicted nucleotidyltransferase component of viral defense system